MARRDGEDPAAFAMQLEILAVRGFRTAELWTEGPFGQCTPGYANPGDSGPLPGCGKVTLIRTGGHLRGWARHEKNAACWTKQKISGGGGGAGLVVMMG